MTILSAEVAFWDSSVLVSLCVRQDNTDQVRAWSVRYGIAVWWSARVEINGAIARLQRDGQIDSAGVNNARSALARLTDGWHEIIPSDEVRDEAEAILHWYPLRVADSLQLAAAMVWSRRKPKGKAFLCADAKLGAVAEQAGFRVLRP